MKLIFTIIAITVFGQSSLFAMSFKNNRYPGPTDLCLLFNQKFPEGKVMSKELCKSNGESYPETEKLWGSNDPATGEPYSQAPSPAFAKWYVDFAYNVIDNDFTSSTYQFYMPSKKYLSNEGIALLYWEMNRQYPKELSSINKMSQIIDFLKWQDIKPNNRALIIQHLVESFVGPGVLKKDKQDALVSRVNLSLDEKSSIQEALIGAVFTITLSDEFLMSP